MRRALVLATLVAACEQGGLWDKPGGTEAEFNKDHYRCVREAGPTDVVLYKLCMKAAGYVLRPKT